jgi:5-methylcytosine-specific restriction endonuclease McrA
MRERTIVAREIAKYLDPPSSYLSEGFSGPVVAVEVLQRWLLLLAPPKKKRPRDPARGVRRANVRELDELCREVIFLRDGNKCRKCGKEATDWCHVHTRGVHSLRWDLDNSFAGCRGCHMNFWHKQPTLAAKWWEKEIGPERYKRLNLRAAKPSRVNHVAVRAYLEQERKNLA